MNYLKWIVVPAVLVIGFAVAGTSEAKAGGFGVTYGGSYGYGYNYGYGGGYNNCAPYGGSGVSVYYGTPYNSFYYGRSVGYPSYYNRGPVRDCYPRRSHGHHHHHHHH